LFILIDFRYTSDCFFGGLSKYMRDFEPVLAVIAFLAVVWLFLYYLNKNKIFLII